MSLTWYDIEEKVKSIIRDELRLKDDVRPLEIQFSTCPYDDWVSVVYVAERLEEEFKVALSDDQINEITNGLDILGYLTSAISKTAAINVDSRTLAFRINDDGRIQAGIQNTDGTWIYADGTSLLPAGVYVVAFSKWGEVLKELEEMVNSLSIVEADLQKFFEKYPELLKCDEYDLLIPQARIVNEEQVVWKADFILHPFDQTGFCKILELKLPQSPTIRQSKSAHPRFYGDLIAALNQLRDYGEAFHSTVTRTKFKEVYHVDVFKPDLQLIAGRKWDLEHMKNMLEFQRRNSIRVDDWDTYLGKLKRKFT